MFRLIKDVVDGADPGFQVLVTEHADIAETWYQESVIERWSDHLKLVPPAWADRPSG
jgi:hypothetical protein